MPRQRRVLVWTTAVLPHSETFIRNQFDALQRWDGKLVGAVRRASPLTRDADQVLYTDSVFGKFGRAFFLRTGRSRRLTQLLKSWKPSVLHAHFLPAGWAVSAAARAANVPLIVTAHGFDATSWPSSAGLAGWIARKRARAVLRRAAKVIAVSEYVRDRVIALGADPRKVIVHHIGIPVPAVTNRPGEPAWDVAFVGRFAAKKGILDLVAALNLIARRRPVSAVLVGDGDLMPIVQDLVQRSVADITVLGAQPPERVKEVLAQSRVFAAPSKTAPNGDAEGFGMVFLEAAAAGLPTAATLHGGVPEAVEDGITGLLSPEGDVELLAANIERLLEDGPFAVEMGERGRRRLEERFDIITQTAKLEDIYASVAAQHKASE